MGLVEAVTNSLTWRVAREYFLNYGGITSDLTNVLDGIRAEVGLDPINWDTITTNWYAQRDEHERQSLAND